MSLLCSGVKYEGCRDGNGLKLSKQHFPRFEVFEFTVVRLGHKQSDDKSDENVLDKLQFIWPLQ